MARIRIKNDRQSLIKEYSMNMLYNVFDNVEKSISYVKRDPKSAVISLYAAVELTFKLRLFIENWFLILQNIDEADFDAFKEGNFSSVYLDTAAKRIKILFEDLDDKYNANSFDTLRLIRNRIIHFDRYQKKDSLIEEAVYSAWHPLFNLLSNRWIHSFSNILSENEYKEKIDKLEKCFKKLSSQYYKPVKKTLIENTLIKNKRNKNIGKCKYEVIPGYKNSETCINCYENKLDKINFLYKKETKYVTIYTCDVCEKSYIGHINYANIEKELIKIIKNDLRANNISIRLPKLANMKTNWEKRLGHRKQIKISQISHNIEDFEYTNIKNDENIIIEDNFVKISGFADISFHISNNEKNDYINEIDLCFYVYYFDIKFSIDQKNTHSSIKITYRDYDGM